MNMKSLDTIIFIFLGLCVGASIASQTGVNATLRMALHSPIQAAFFSFLIGTLFLGVLVFLNGGRWFIESRLASLPWWAWLGGFLGACNIAVSIFLAPRLGALLLAVSVVTGQIIASLVFDHLGALGYPKIELSITRVLGSVLVFIGLLLVAHS